MLLYVVLLFGIFTFNVLSQPIILGSCKDNEFKCNDGVCIPQIWLCDYEIDCKNGEDEVFDIDGNECIPCQERGYFCHDSNKCIPPQWKCDGWSDCADKSDELYCIPCTDNQFTCNDGKCIDNTSICDYKNDCFNGEDEIHDINGNDCPVCPFQCDGNTTCITEASKLCDGHFDCTDKTDECLSSICSEIQGNIECDILSSTSLSPLINTPSPTPIESSPIDLASPTWKYCPRDIVWLGFINIFENNNNKTAVYWIEPKVKEEGKYYEKHSKYRSGDQFGVGLYPIEYIGKKINNINGTYTNITDDPIFCPLRILVLDGMRDYEISNCESQSMDNDYLEWQFVVDDNNYEIAYFDIGPYQSDIERARFVPNHDQFHTDCYAEIAFETGIITENEEEIVIKETVNWVVDHLWALIGLIVGVVLLFCILLIVIIILWRKHVEMKEFIRADTYDKDEDDDYSNTNTDNEENINIIDTKRPSTIDLDITTPGGLGYIGNKSYITPSSQYSYSGRSNGGNIGHQTQFEYNLNHLNNNIHTMNMSNMSNISNISNNNNNNNNNGQITANIDSDTDSSDDDDDNLLNNLKKTVSSNGISPSRRPSILGVTREQLKILQDKDTKKKMDHDADKLLEAEWDRESQNSSQGL